MSESEAIGAACASVLGELNAQLAGKPEQYQATVVRALTEMLTAQLKNPTGQRVMVPHTRFGDPNIFVMAQECEVVLDALVAYLHATEPTNPTIEWARTLFLKLCRLGQTFPIFVWQDSVTELRAELEKAKED